ncbi:transcription initiation factor TFIID subunit 4B [Ascaphus truei]|uniref:transcription initiation factor TFIID subunit 4B n=1 Tax=Ascaphus truei TaxID=8439 RepID=UPI003F598133
MHAKQAASAAPASVSHGVSGAASLDPKNLPGASSSDLITTQAVTKPPMSVSLVPASQPAVLSVPGCTLVTNVAPLPVTSQTPKVIGGPRMTAPQQVVPPKASQTTTIQLPANFQIPPGTVLIKSGNGQLILVSQQALARAQAQVQNTSARPPISTNTPKVQLCTIQHSGTQLLSKVASTTTVKTAPLSAPLTTFSLSPTVQRNASVLQSAAATNSVVQVSASASLGTRQNAPLSAPTVVRICAPSTTRTASGTSSIGTSTVLIRASTPANTAVTTFSCTSTATPATTAAPVGITTTSVMGVGTTSITVLPFRASPLVTPKTVNACTSIVTSASTLATSLTTTLPASIRTPTSSCTTVFKTCSSSTIPTTAATCGSAAMFTTANICATTTAAGTCSPVITSTTIRTSPSVMLSVPRNNVPTPTPVQVNTPPAAHNVISIKAEPPKGTQSMQPPNSTETLDNVKKCKNFLATLIKLASSGPQSPTMGQNVKNLVQNLLDAKIEPEEFTTKLYTELKSSPQPYLVPFLKKSLPALRRLMPNSQTFILQCGQQTPPTSGTLANTVSVKVTPTPSIQTAKQVCATTLGSFKVQQTSSTLTQPINTLKTVNFKHLVVQQPARGIVKHVATLPQASALTIQKSGENRIPLNALIQANHFPASILKRITLPGNKIISLQASPIRKENGTACFREEDDINDVTSMAGVNLNEEHACILATNSELVGALIRSCKDEPFLLTSALQKRMLDIGKRHDIKELHSDVVNLVSHATQERLRGIIEKLTVAAQHRATNYKDSDRYVKSSDTRAQLKFLEQLEHLEKLRKNEEEREMLFRAAKSRSNKEDPEQLRLKQKAKEMQQMELAQMQYREANLTALAAIGPRKKRPLDSVSLQSGLEGLHATGSSAYGVSKSLSLPRITRVCLRDLIFCMEQEKETRHSISLYRALLM